MKRRRARVLVLVPLALLVVALTAACGSVRGTRTPVTTTPTPTGQVSPASGGVTLQNAVVRVVGTVSPSVVQIQDSAGLGSGIVFDRKGDIVTNAHVVSDATSFTVTTSKGKQYRAQLVGTFKPDDLAVIRISGGSLPAARFADSSKLQVGDIAIAIGNPLGLRSSVTMGIVSAFREGIPEGNGVALPDAIQTSAEINPGNSGGALVDLKGRVIGIPTLAAIDPQLGGTAPGIGFAITSNTVKLIATQIVAHGHVVNSHRAYLGARVGDTGGNGVYVANVSSGGPAASGGIRVGDVIVSLAGHATPTVATLTSLLARLQPGTRVKVVVKHQKGSHSTRYVTLGQYPG